MSREQKIKPNLLTGVIHVASNNVGYVSVEGVEEDVQIQPGFINTALHRDTVEIALLPKKSGDTRAQGEVVRVAKRAKSEFVGVIDKRDENKNFAFLIPDDARVHIDIFIPDARDKKVKHDHKALVRITDWGEPKKNPSGEIVKMLGKKGDNNVEMESILLESGYRPDFPPTVVREAKQIHEKAKRDLQKEKGMRRDCTGVATFTIDPSDAKDLDDALSIKQLDADTFEVGIHIADVSHYVAEDTAIDLHARDKGNSVYLVDRAYPMLPEVLSSDMCSLNPGEDKLTFSVILKIKKDGSVTERWFGKTLINSDKRFSYQEAQAAIDEGGAPYGRELKSLNELAQKFQKQRADRGALVFEQEEIQFKFDNAGRPVEIYEKEILPAHKLIEEFMILANNEVAKYFVEKERGKKGSGIYRVHEPPKTTNINELLAFLNVIGYDLQVPQKTITSKELNTIFAAVKDKNEERLVAMVAMQDMAKAVYSLENKGHFGLALENYTHFTSPIRRYADLMVHRVLYGYLQNKPPAKSVLEKYKVILAKLTQSEIFAMTAERDSIKYKQIEYMLARKGKVYEGVIMNVFNWGMFVQEKTTKTEGLIKTRNMQDDFYVLDEFAYSLVGQKTQKKYAIGNTVKIKVAGGDLDQKMLDYKLASY